MEYIVAERLSKKEIYYVENYYQGDSIHMTDIKEEAHRFGLSDATSIAQKNGMYIEEAD